MSFSSFYGGRIGASFIIVKRFDAISIEENTKYKTIQCAVNENGLFYITNDGTDYHFIEKTADNFNDYSWQWLTLNGIPVDTIDKDTGVISQNDPGIAYQEGMVQCFMKGGDSTDIVNYGEYVIIDTPIKENPDNGKVYRRGMNYDYDPVDNPLAGAEYIGQISGPRGATPEVQFDHYEDIINKYGSKANQRYYDVLPDKDIVPGSWEESGVRKFKDEIDYVYATMVDSLGNVTGAIIGFKIPTLVDDFEARSMSPYKNRAIDEQGKYYNYDLITEDSSEYIGGKWKHPFYQKWQIKVPHGYHGINSTNIEVIPSYTMPKGFKSDDYLGAPVYIDEALTEPYIVGGQQLHLETSYEILRDTYYVDGANYAVVQYGIEQVYVPRDDCYMDILRYRETDFDNIEEGEVTYYELGSYNTIRRITLSENGVLTVFYNAEAQPQVLEEVIRWIDTVDSDGITIDEDGTVVVHYNTLDSHGDHETQTYSKVLDWITEVTLTQDGKFDVLYNNDTIQDGHYHTNLNWIDKVSVSDDGTVDFYFNDDHDNPKFSFTKILKVLDDVQIQTIADGDTYEGTGDQKVHVTYNITDSAGDKITEAIGNPLNYIIESIISVPSEKYPNVPFSHLLVYYSDPVLRGKYRDKWVTYPSTKVIDGTDPVTGDPIYHVWTEWVDLGNVRGSSGGIHIIKDVSSMSELEDSSGNAIPPERLEDSSGVIINPDGAGWGVTLSDPTDPTAAKEFLFYDYETKEWYSVGSLDSIGVDPRYIVIKSAPIPGTKNPNPADVNLLNVHGFWFAAEEMKYAF